MLTFQILEDKDWLPTFEKLGIDEFQKAKWLLQLVGQDTVSYLRSLTTEMRPPARAGEPDRRAHPGHWADVTTNLRQAYGYRVERSGDHALLLILDNTMEYAATLEARDGFFVLGGVMERDGPVEQAIRAAAERVGWKVTA